MRIVTKKKYNPTTCPGCEEKPRLNYNGGGNYTVTCNCDETKITKSPDEAYDAWEKLVPLKRDNLDTVYATIMYEMQTDDQDPFMTSGQLVSQHEQNPEIIDNFLMSLCGWTMETLLKKSRGEM